MSHKGHRDEGEGREGGGTERQRQRESPAAQTKAQSQLIPRIRHKDRKRADRVGISSPVSQGGEGTKEDKNTDVNGQGRGWRGTPNGVGTKA